MAQEKIQFTEEGFRKLQEEYDRLVHVTREEVKAELAEARSQGDLSENADYDAAREKQAQVEHRIEEIAEQLKNAEIIKETGAKDGLVHMLSTIEVELLDTNEVMKFKLVGSNEADPLNETDPKLGIDTPLAKAVLDHKAGQTVDVLAKKPYKVKIVSVN